MSKDIDLAVALEVMGWAALFAEREVCDRGFCPSTDIADAWRVVERLGELGMQINVGHAGERLDRWEANVYQIFRSVDESDRVDVEVGADTAPEAICKAALAAVRAMKEARDEQQTN